MTFKAKRRWRLAGFILLGALGIVYSQLSSIGAALILHPLRRHAEGAPPISCQTVVLQGAGVELHGWRGEAVSPRRGSLIYLHGVMDNRMSSAGVLSYFLKQGFDVVAYDSRAHGESGGTICSYGIHEKEDLRQVVSTLKPGPVLLFGSSLGAAVALQLAASDERISAVIAAETFSDLRTVAIERAPWFFTRGAITRAFANVELEGQFKLDEASPVLAASKITAPVLLIHGEKDADTSPAHSRRIFEALKSSKRLILVPDAGHNQSLNGSSIWKDVQNWVDAVIPYSR
jgi:pimeloyl-ACP methyl ester carboxylesterase